MRHTLATLSPALSADRMVKEYVERLYIPASQAARVIAADGNRPARELAAWKARVYAAWPKVHVTHVESGGVDLAPQVGDELHVRAHVDLDGLSPDDVSVDVVYGRAWDTDTMTDTQLAPLEFASAEAGQAATFAGTVELKRAGNFGYTVRVTPRNALLASPAELGLVTTAL
jgi:starch phosphorylase